MNHPWHDSGELWPGRSDIQEISPGGGVYHKLLGAKNFALLQSRGITHVLICADELNPAFPKAFDYLKLDVFTENTSTELSKHINTALPWKKKSIRQGGRALLHFATGSSRSDAIAVAYLMSSQAMCLQEALAFARQARAIIKPNPGFLDQLQEKEHRSLP